MQHQSEYEYGACYRCDCPTPFRSGALLWICPKCYREKFGHLHPLMGDSYPGPDANEFASLMADLLEADGRRLPWTWHWRYLRLRWRLGATWGLWWKKRKRVR